MSVTQRKYDRDKLIEISSQLMLEVYSPQQSKDFLYIKVENIQVHSYLIQILDAELTGTLALVRGLMRSKVSCICQQGMQYCAI
jgi:hypothetical protein